MIVKRLYPIILFYLLTATLALPNSIFHVEGENDTRRLKLEVTGDRVIMSNSRICVVFNLKHSSIEAIYDLERNPKVNLVKWGSNRDQLHWSGFQEYFITKDWPKNRGFDAVAYFDPDGAEYKVLEYSESKLVVRFEDIEPTHGYAPFEQVNYTVTWIVELDALSKSFSLYRYIKCPKRTRAGTSLLKMSFIDEFERWYVSEVENGRLTGKSRGWLKDIFRTQKWTIYDEDGVYDPITIYIEETEIYRGFFYSQESFYGWIRLHVIAFKDEEIGPGDFRLGKIVVSMGAPKPTFNFQIRVPMPVPFGRLFQINLKISNPGNELLKLRVVLDERTGFQAGAEYGDGDEIVELTLDPGEVEILSFTAKVYGVLRNRELVLIKIYNEHGELLQRIEHWIELKPEVAKLETVLTPLVVVKGKGFTVGIPVFYTFTYSTKLRLTLTCKDSGKTLAIDDMIKGDDVKIYTFRVDETLVSLDKPKTLEFRLRLEVYYPEEDYRLAQKEELTFTVRIAEETGSSIIIPLTAVYYNLNYKGERYIAVYAYNISHPTQLPSEAEYEDIIRHIYSRRNWLVFKVDKDRMQLVTNDGLYRRLAFAAEVAYLRWGIWNRKNLQSRLTWFSELRDLALRAEGSLFISRLAGKLLGVLLLKKIPIPSTLAGVSVTGRVSSTTLTVERMITVLKRLKFMERVLEALDAGAVGEDVMTWIAIFSLGDAAKLCREANSLLVNVDFGSTISISEAEEFYSKVQLAETFGLSGIAHLAARYIEDSLRAFKEAILEAVPLVGDAVSFYEKLRDGLGIPEALKFGLRLVTTWEEFELRRRVLMDQSLRFRDSYLEDTANSTIISLSEPLGQRKLLLHVYDIQGRHVGLDLETTLVEVEIPDSYYLDVGGIIAVIIPREVEIDHVVVSARYAEETEEEYTLTVTVFKEGTEVSRDVESKTIKRGEESRFRYWESMKNGRIVVDLRRQYFVEVRSNYGEVRGGGWFDPGAVVEIQAIPPTAREGERYLWIGWKGVGDGSYTGPDNPAKIIVKGPIVQTATWKRQFYLRVISKHGDPKGEGWYDENSTAIISVKPSIKMEGLLGLLGGRLVFAGWTGDIMSLTPTAFVVMDRPKTVIATWREDYRMVYLHLGVLIAILAGLIALIVIRSRRRG